MRTIANKGICLCLSFLLASGVLLSGLACPRQAHAVVPALAIPAGAAAAGVTAENAMVAFGMILAATTGISLQKLVGADLPDPGTWTQQQWDVGESAFDGFIDWNKGQIVINGNSEAWKKYQESIKTDKKVGSGGPSDQDPNEWDNNSAWWLIAAVVGGGVASDSMSYLVDGAFDFIDNFLPDDMKEEILLSGNYDPVKLNSDSHPGMTTSIPVTNLKTRTADGTLHDVPNLVNYNGQAYILIGYYRSTSSWSYAPSGLIFKPTFSSNNAASVGIRAYYPSSGSYLYLDFAFKKQNDGTYSFEYKYTSNTVTVGDDYSKSFYGFGIGLTTINPVLASLINPDYSIIGFNSLNEQYILDGLSDVLSDAFKNFTPAPIINMLNDMATVQNPSTGNVDYNVTRPVSDGLPTDWPNIWTKTPTKPSPSDSDREPDQPSDNPIDVPEDYKFPDSWAELEFRRVFPFFFFDDLYKLADSWLPEKSYKSSFSITVPSSFWSGDGKGQKLTVDASPFEPYRKFVRGVFLALVFVGLVARLFDWWAGATTRNDGD